MNLSSYLQMPPAPLVPTNTSNTVPQGTRVGVDPSVGNSLGFDFADVMARQLQRLVPQQRQTIAADASKTPEQAYDNQDSRPVVEDKRSSDRPEQEARNTRTDNQDSEQKETDQSSAQTIPRKQNTTHRAEHTDVDALLAGLMQGAPATPVITPTTPTAASSSDSVGAAAAQATPNDLTIRAAALQTVQLSPQVRIITDPKAAPSPESLAAFAKSMGLDESAIQDLMAQQPSSPTSEIASNLASANTTGGTTASPLATSNALQATLGSALSSSPQGAMSANSAVATQMAAMATTPEQPLVVSGAGLAAPTTTLVAPATHVLAGLTPTDMAAIQQLQITVLPAAVLPLNTNTTGTSTPSTLSMLSLLGTGVEEKDVSALLSRFSQDSGNESNPDQQSSQDQSNSFSSFAQALSSNKTTANTNPANATQVSNTNLSEAYDQLSDKLATEMAARMHKQLSDGEWKMKFALRPSNLGGVEIHLEMKDGKLDAVFRADNPLTRDLLQNSTQRLREALGNFGINAGQVNIGQGGGNSQQNSSKNSNKTSQVRDNSSSQVNGTGSTLSAPSTRNKANASLLDLYA